MIRPEEVSADLLKKMDDEECVRLCEVLRSELIQDVSRTGGHLASNLGAVELTVAIHRVYDTGRDRLVFDVGHQCYCHKLLTGRQNQMDTLRKLNGLSGFPKPNESVHDAFVAGHASNSVSVALGMARARTLTDGAYDVIALIGDGALTGGLSYEGLSDAGDSGEKLLVILNDNGMSIVRNVGGIARHLAAQRLKPQYIRLKKWYRRVTSKSMLGRGLYKITHAVKAGIKSVLLPSSYFEDMGFNYLGPVDGHDAAQLTRVLQYAKSLDGPTLLHVRTVKGKGYAPAERTPDAFHGVSPFDPATGRPLKPAEPDFSAVFGEEICALAREDGRICAVTAAMLPGTALTAFQKEFPDRCFDVGIAEGHAVSMAAGMARQGAIPVFAVYSTFLQRGYDMLIHDVSLQQLHVVFCVDRAGLVGSDGETHQGLFDVAYLSTVPGMTILAPASFAELRRMLRTAVLELSGPAAVRYPRGGEDGFAGDSGPEPAVCLRSGPDLTIAAYGTMTGEALRAAEALEARGIRAEVIKFNQICPLRTEVILASLRKTGRLVIAEEAARHGSLGPEIVTTAAEAGVPLRAVRLLNLGAGVIPQGSVSQLRSLYGIDSRAIERAAAEVCQHG